jgi:hypothetical protein
MTCAKGLTLTAWLLPSLWPPSPRRRAPEVGGLRSIGVAREGVRGLPNAAAYINRVEEPKVSTYVWVLHA